MFSNIAVLDFESQLFCIVIVSILLYKQRSSTNQAEVQFVFSHVLISQIVFFAVGILRIIVTENTFFNTWEMVYLANAAYFIAFNATTYECFRYIVIYEGVPLLQSRKNRFLAQIPLIFNALMILLTPITRLYYVIDGNADFAMMPLWYLNPAISVFYPIAGIFANYLYRRSQDRGELRRYRLLIAFPLLIICSTLLQLLDWAIPFLPDGIVLADLIVYISYTDSLISKDPLTGINNRSELTRYLTGRIRQNNLQAELYYFIMDIDKFKHINDTYGHGEGDHALVLLANALKRVSSSRETRCFISRYGGDEFVGADSRCPHPRGGGRGGQTCRRPLRPVGQRGLCLLPQGHEYGHRLRPDGRRGRDAIHRKKAERPRRGRLLIGFLLNSIINLEGSSDEKTNDGYSRVHPYSGYFSDTCVGRAKLCGIYTLCGAPCLRCRELLLSRGKV